MEKQSSTMNEVEKIKDEIVRLKGQLVRGACAAQIEMRTICKEEAYDEVLSFISSIESEHIAEPGKTMAGGGRDLSADIGQDHAPSLAPARSDF
jgi:hypothetical protein